jgi:sulfur-oxidizing protein SoxY
VTVIRFILRPGACLAALLSLALPALGDTSRGATAEQPSESWEFLKGQVFGDRPIRDGAGMIALDAPYRAEDAAIVPIGLSIDPGPDRRVTALTLVIDENPVPVAAEFELGAMGRRVELAVRVRVDAYSNVRAIAELDDGTLHQVARFVKASGGCSAPALKDHDAAMASLGEIRLRRFAPAEGADASDSARPEAQVMVRHPNNSGFQMDPLSRHYIPALFVDRLSVLPGDELLFRMTGGISISEDPTVRFRYSPNGAPIEVIAADTDGREFRESFPADGPS